MYFMSLIDRFKVPSRTCHVCKGVYCDESNVGPQPVHRMLTTMREQQKADHDAALALDKDTVELQQDTMNERPREDEYDAMQIEQRGLRLAEMKRFEEQLIQLEIELNQKKRQLEFYHDLPTVRG